MKVDIRYIAPAPPPPPLVPQATFTMSVEEVHELYQQLNPLIPIHGAGLAAAQEFLRTLSSASAQVKHL